MKQVGMDDTMIKHTIKKQILMVFFIPLAGMVLHILFATPMIQKLMSILLISDAKMIFLSILTALICFVSLYILSYFLTSKAYYRIVK